MMDVGAVAFDPLRDIRHREAVAARDQSDWLKWLELDNKSPRTLYEYERRTSTLLRAFPGKQFKDFTDGDIAQVLAAIPARSRTVSKAAYNSWFSWGYRQRKVAGNPVDLLPAMRYRANHHYNTFSEVESDALSALPQPDGALCTIMLWTGLRRQEARYLTGKRVDYAQRQLLILEGAKGSKQRQIPLVGRAAAAFEDLTLLEGIGPDQYFWHTRTRRGRLSHEKPTPDSSFQLWWKTCLKDAGVPYRVAHTTRHTFATRLRELGLPMDDIQHVLGHESIRTTMDIYVHADAGARGDRIRAAVGDL